MYIGRRVHSECKYSAGLGCSYIIKQRMATSYSRKLWYFAWEDQRRRQCYIFHIALLRCQQCYMKNHIAHLVRKLGMQAFYGIDLLLIQLAKLLKRLEGCSLFLFDGFCWSSTYLLLTGSLPFRALQFFCFCAPCRYVLKLIEAFSDLVEASRSRSRASELHTTDSQLAHQ